MADTALMPIPGPIDPVPVARDITPRADGRVDLIGLPRKRIAELFEEAGLDAKQAKLRANQVFHWLYHRGVTEFEAMTDIAKTMRPWLAERFVIGRPEVVEAQHSSDGTRKWLLRTADAHDFEMVFIPDADRGTLCVSSQVGCTLNCRFCHTGTMRLVRNLTPGEIVGQVMLARDALGEWPKGRMDFAVDDDGEEFEEHGGYTSDGRLLTNIVMMGMGGMWLADGERWGFWSGTKNSFFGSGPKPIHTAYDRGGIEDTTELRAGHPHLRLQDMDRDHVWGHLVFGPVTSIKTGDEAFMQACYAAYNDWLYEDFCSAAPDRLIGVAMLPPYPEAAFAELKRLAEKGGCRQANLQIAVAEPRLEDPRWEPLFDLLEQTGIVLSFHVTVFPKAGDAFDKYKGSPGATFLHAKMFIEQFLDPFVDLFAWRRGPRTPAKTLQAPRPLPRATTTPVTACSASPWPT